MSPVSAQVSSPRPPGPPRPGGSPDSRAAKPHYVLCLRDKRPIHKGWQLPANRPGAAAVRRHYREGGLVGAIPDSLGCFVVDLDHGGVDAEAEIRRALGGWPAARIATRRESGAHLWFPGRHPGKAVWQLPPSRALPEGAAGDLIGQGGYAILWDPKRLFDGLADARARDAEPFEPARLLGRADACGAPHAGEAAAWRQGNRNNTLNQAVFDAARSGNDEALIAALRQARRSGLKAAEIARTAASAAAAGTDEWVRETALMEAEVEALRAQAAEPEA